MKHHRFRSLGPIAALSLLVGLSAAGVAGRAGVVRADSSATTQVGSKIDTGKACYVRMPDLPAARMGGFGGYNAKTGVMTFAGGGAELGADITIAHYDLWAIRLDGTMNGWNTVPYGSNVGYMREKNKGCREMTSMMLADNLWVSVLGADGCDTGKIDPDNGGGDVRILQIGDTADRSGVSWTMHGLNVPSVPQQLASKAGRLVRHFAVVDSSRGRAVLGQGTFDERFDGETEDEVYVGTPSGNQWSVRQLRTEGPTPARRYGSCAAYIHDKDTGVDGVMVLGGKAGGAGPAYKEVWWLDFAKNANGEWSDISSRFSNLDELGYRYDGACAYNPSSKQFYSWMGQSDSKIADGARFSAGTWRVDLSPLGTAGAPMTWERLAPDKMADIEGRELIPSTYDWVHNRLFAMGGLNGMSEYADVWAIYPDLTGAACANLDPYAPFAPQPTATSAPTNTPDPAKPTSELPTQAPPPTDPPIDPANLCDIAKNKVPAAVIAAAQANPQGVAGYGLRCNPNLAPSPANPPRTWLSLRSPSLPFHPLFNGLSWKCGCP